MNCGDVSLGTSKYFRFTTEVIRFSALYFAFGSYLKLAGFKILVPSFHSGVPF